MYGLLLVFGCLAGVTTVLFGFGGGFVVVPLLYAMLAASHAPDTAIARNAMHIAVATSTCVMIFGASMATWRHHRARTLAWEHVRPLAAYIAAGAVAGAAAAVSLSGDWVRWAFVAYLAATILDSLLRPGFLHDASERIRPMSRLATAAAGIIIGTIAAFLGVGGSVMTVPLMRRRGASMTAATAMANPLSLPMALTGTATYVLMQDQSHALGAWYAGYVDVRAFVVLAAGSWLGIRVASRWIGRIPDALHARIYLLLLTVVLAVMVVA
ncbi:sulfite exporter TauE/SafE family protein [Bordetella genomosp. 9]|uniref:Probable membrane transporter protein n=1 Tax=Bordetella genomosp. 9 TaxID=1416803 RepID=A0A1W6YWN8_9BORD|nr:sulfite exporter TauE/SafE family protein [Bordetella genomosp. 9]ARP85394.1 permease [Bordetella genomosp. 9]